MFPPLSDDSTLDLYLYSFSFNDDTRVYINNRHIDWPLGIDGLVATYYTSDRFPDDFITDWRVVYVPAKPRKSTAASPSSRCSR